MHSVLSPREGASLGYTSEHSNLHHSILSELSATCKQGMQVFTCQVPVCM